jgi:hypothetical protein
VIQHLIDRLPPSVRAALALAVLSIPFVAWSLLIPPDPESLEPRVGVPPIAWQPMTVVQAIVLATTVVLIAALVSGWLAGLARRRQPWWAVTAAIWTAWVLGIIVLPLVAAATGIPLATGIECVRGCEAHLRSDMPLSGLAAYVESLAGVLMIPYVPVILLVVLWFAVRTRWLGLAIATVIGLHASINWFSIFLTGAAALVPYACLVLGVIGWAVWMRRTEPTAAPSVGGPSVTPVGAPGTSP